MHCVDDWEEDMDLVEWGEHVVDNKFGTNDVTATHLAAKYDRVESIYNKYNLAKYSSPWLDILFSLCT